MKAAELRELPSSELAARLDETKEELFNLRFQHATGQLENYGLLGQARRDVARILSIQHERELGISPEPSAEEAEASRRRRAADEEASDEARRPRRRGLLRGRGAEGRTDDELEPEDLPQGDEPGAEPGVVPLVEHEGDEETEE